MPDLQNIAIILDKPQMGENIGAAARAMKNFGVSELRLVNPRDGWPNKRAEDMSASAIDIIQNALVFTSFEEAVSDRNILYATTGGARDMEKASITPKIMAEEIFLNTTNNIGIVFGCERTGLENLEISFCNKIVYIPVDKKYTSMNLAQAICVVCYELFQKNLIEGEDILQKTLSPAATQADMNSLFKFLETELERSNFFQVEEKKHKMMINIRDMFTKMNFTEQEIKTFRGILNALKSDRRCVDK
ncbi:MAG TPA: rRNA methyltransferase [Alphaproteobacteria bacterium]|mgnify:CR=1 FL=1|nr:rRNA methyltransferase [Alphaproteobacteria bacterium]